jgi:hypothetical protein
VVTAIAMVDCDRVCNAGSWCLSISLCNFVDIGVAMVFWGYRPVVVLDYQSTLVVFITPSAYRTLLLVPQRVKN